MKSDFLKEAQARGFVHQATDLDGLDELLSKQSITAYIGFDATAPSLHIGNLVSLMLLRLLAKHGHQAIALMGSGTTAVGDPSFRASDRPLLDESTIESYSKTIYPIIQQVIPNAKIIDNAGWLKSLNYLSFLRDYGRHFSVNRMLSFDSVKLRMEREQSLSFLEFNYMILQAYDFVHLAKEHGCVLQMGGSDQWGNIVNGVELARRVGGVHQLYGLTSPLVTTSQGTKMGKTAQGAVWMKADMLSPFDYWQFWRNTDDADVVRFLKLFTGIPVDEIEKYNNVQGAELNEAKILLADAATTICHGQDVLNGIHQAIQNTFGHGSDSLDGLPEYIVSAAQCPIAIEDLFVASGLASSKGAVRRLAEGRGVRLDNEVIEDSRSLLNVSDFPVKLSVGKKQHIAVKLES